MQKLHCHSREQTVAYKNCLQKFEQLQMTNKEKEVKGENGNNIKHGVEL
jgi:hypothetical protein